MISSHLNNHDCNSDFQPPWSLVNNIAFERFEPTDPQTDLWCGFPPTNVGGSTQKSTYFWFWDTDSGLPWGVPAEDRCFLFTAFLYSI